MASNLILEVKDLCAGYGGKIFLHDITLSLRRGEFAGVIGPNGSGKTTFLRALSRVLRPVKGSVLISGCDIWTIPQRELARQMAFVPQGLNYDLNITVEELVLMGRIPHRNPWQLFENRRDEEVAEQAMKQTGILHLRNRRINELSGGEAQLASVSRALAQEPTILLLDEPTAHLDICHQVRLLNLIRKLNRKNGLTILVVLHDLNLASEYCDTLILLWQGTLCAIGPPAQVITSKSIQEVYQASVTIAENPISGRPHVYVVAPPTRLNGA